MNENYYSNWRKQHPDVEEIPSKVVKEWSYADSKDLSMNLGGLIHDASTLIAPTITPESTKVSAQEVAQKVMGLVYELYLEKEQIIKKIKNS